MRVAGCSTKALVYTWDGNVHEATIDHGDALSLHFQGMRPISRKDIRYIDHPGNVTATIGTIGIFLAAPLAVVSGLERSGCKDLGCFGPTFALIVTGAASVASAAIAIWGYYTWGCSTIAAAQFDQPADLGPDLTPVALTDGERTFWGLAVNWRW